MKLYYSKGACSLSVRILIHEMGLSAEFESVDLKTKKTETGADYFQINPKGAVPGLLLDNNELLTENIVIHQYLADTHKATNLLPAFGDKKRYRVVEWLSYVSSDLHKSFGPFFNPDVPEEIKEKVFKPILKRKFSAVEKQLQSNPFLAGDHFTLPDAYLFVVLRWMPTVAKVNLSEFPKLENYFSELKKRKSVQQALKEENLS